jgi:hypothetical protein
MNNWLLPVAGMPNVILIALTLYDVLYNFSARFGKPLAGLPDFFQGVIGEFGFQIVTF